MFIIQRTRGTAVLLAGVAAGVAIGCTRDADRLRTTTAAASSTPGQTASDSAAAQSSTGTTAADSIPSKATVETARTPLPRPSIDPGRKPATARPKAVSKPVTDSAQPAVADTPTTSAASKPAASSQAQAPKYDAGSNTVTFDLIGGPNGFMFNGFGSGGATLTLPANAKVVMNFINKDGTPHSAQVISGEGPLPTASVDAAISRAYTNQLTQGLPQEGTDVMRFTAPASGTYRIICGVPGHALSGMWIWMKVDPSAKTPSFGPTKS